MSADLSGLEVTLLVLVGVAYLVLIALLIWVLRLRTRVRWLQAHRPAGPADLAELRRELAGSLRNVAVVRYDAFGDMGGRLSFSAALLDETGDGVVISSIHARGESRTYAKGLVGGKSDTTLTPEEQQALAAARSGKASA